MRRMALALPLVLLVMAPTAVRAAADDLIACDAPEEGTTAVGPDATLNPAVASPQFDVDVYTWTDFSYQMDLYPAKALDKARVTATLNWSLDVNDYNLYILDSNGERIASSEGFQSGPIGDAPTETVTMKLKHCTAFTVQVYNEYALVSGPVGDTVDPLELTITTGSVEAAPTA